MSGALRGPDVSQWQGIVDWKAVAKWAAFGWTKATDGTGFVYASIKCRISSAICDRPGGSTHEAGRGSGWGVSRGNRT